MKVALVQFDINWEDPYNNREVLDSIIQKIPNDVDLIILPEMFNTGFSMNTEGLGEDMSGETVKWLKNTAISMQSAITGSLIVLENNKYYNRLVFIHPDGKVEFYDKRHLFTLAGENKKFTAGKQKLIINYKDFKICPLICYDLRFPVFSNNVEGYDLLLYVANWPKKRIKAWDILLKARSVENMCYTIGVNRIGVDGNNIDYCGNTQVVDCLGEYILEPQNKEGFFVVELDKAKLLQTRNIYNFLNDLDKFELKI